MNRGGDGGEGGTSNAEQRTRHQEGECTTPTQTLIIEVKDFVFCFLEKKDKLLIGIYVTYQ